MPRKPWKTPGEIIMIQRLPNATTRRVRGNALAFRPHKFPKADLLRMQAELPRVGDRAFDRQVPCGGDEVQDTADAWSASLFLITLAAA